jgi:hypothetical protein
MGFLPSRVTPELERMGSSPNSSSFLVLASRQLLRTVAYAASSCCTFKDVLSQLDRNHLLPVSLPQGSDPLMGILLWDLCATSVPRGKPLVLLGGRLAPSQVLI